MLLKPYDRRKIVTFQNFHSVIARRLDNLSGRRGNLKRATDRHGLLKGLAMTSFTIFLWMVVPLAFAASSVVINKFGSSDNSDWIEIYNSAQNEVRLTGWTIKDTASTSIYEFSEERIPASGSCYLSASNRLNNSGDRIQLFNGATEESCVSYGTGNGSYCAGATGADITAPSSSQTAIRIPDAGQWQISQSSTKSTTLCSDLIPSPTPTSTPAPSPTVTPKPASTTAPTQTPTPSPKPTSTPKPTAVPTSKTTPKPSIVLADSDNENSISGNEDQPEIDLAIKDAMSPAPTNEPEVLGTDSTKTSKPSLPIILIIAGTLLTLAGGILLAYYEIKNKQK